MSGRPCGAFQRPPLPLPRFALRSSASANRSLWRTAIGRAVAEPADRLDAAGDEDVALAAADRVRGHADRLQRRRAVAIDGGAGHVEPGENAGRPADVGARLTGRLGAAPDDVFDELAVEPDLAQHVADDEARTCRRGARR